MRSVPLDKMAERWQALPRRRALAPRYETQCVVDITKFVQFVKKHNPKTEEMAAVTDEMVRAFMKAEETRGVSPKRYNEVLKLLRSCFGNLRKEAGMATDPVEGIPTKELDTVHRHPFSQEELKALIAAAKGDPYIYPLIIVGVTTAMRLGDCATLCWEKIDSSKTFIDVKTAKTNTWVTIPIFPLLHEILATYPAGLKGYIFPELAKQYKIAPDGLLKRVRKIMTQVGFGDPCDFPSSNHQESKGAFHQKREHGLRQASIRDFHSFRVTWVTLALNERISPELVCKVTGHKTIEIVLRHYHQPNREDYRRELLANLPDALTGKKSQPTLTMAAIRTKLLSMNADCWEQVRDELIRTMPE